MKVPAGGTCSLTRCSRAAATLQVVATGAHTAETGHILLREARLGRDHHHADVEHDAFAETIGRAPDHDLSSSNVTSTLHYIDTMLGPDPRAKGTDCVALGEERRGRECDE